ncbi:patatin-like phospholipase family protein [Candidatus Gracilibacteria bacterium]|nr:patatin-like phospholipase family protein [Candidatus Gracilibacteria bacterium]
MKKDIILIIGSGGLSGVFSAGVLKALEHTKIYERIDSVYAVSVGACMGARFLVGESELAGRTFYTRFNTNSFIRGHFVKYFFQVLSKKYISKNKVDNVIDFDYFNHVVLNSEDKIDIAGVLSSKIPFYVKVFNQTKGLHQYIKAEEPYGYEKIISSASMTPLIYDPIKVNDEILFDGDTIASRLEEDVIKNNPDKICIKISNIKFSGKYWLQQIPTLCYVYILLNSMYGWKTGYLYAKNFFKKPYWEYQIDKYDNLIHIENNINIGTFCTDTQILQASYKQGLNKGKQLLKKIT